MALQSKTKEFFEKSPKIQSFFISIVLVGTSMVIGDGALTPAISVVSAVQGIQSRSDKITQSAEAMFADLGHFNKTSIQMAFSFLVYPALILTYGGQGVAVIWVMLITTCLMVVVMLVIWQTNVALILLFFAVFIFIEGIFMTSLLRKVPQGGWVPFAIATFFLIIMLSYTCGRSKKTAYEAERKMSRSDLTQLLLRDANIRVPGICFFCTDLVNGIPPIIGHYVQHVGSLHEVMVVVTVRTLPIKSVLPEERYLVGKLGPNGVYRCLVQYGYKDVPNMDGDEFITSLVEKLTEAIESPIEIQQLESAANSGVVYVMGRTVLKPSEKNGCLAHIVIDYFYRFLQNNFRSAVSTLNIPPSKMLQVGMLYEI
ncbi:hypothetical protein IFM89_024795 [Coptis chinensis]|uniref:Potassium transporter n=1 Tax=Coptis chinensis TaxID=261450 RepID=A0A835HRW2_9MAGN|nr:hypothetical protein IFM89_024795 [Coptis chinensis]